MAVSFIGGGNRSIRRKQPTCHKLVLRGQLWDKEKVVFSDRLNSHDMFYDWIRER
jgi:hypothetical protein